MMRSLGKAELGATTLCALSQSGDECGSNGLPLTPNGIRIIGQFKKLKDINHIGLCKYIDIVRAKHERLIVVAEHYRENLHNELKTNKYSECSALIQLAYEILEALVHLNKHGIVHRNLSPHHVLFDDKGHVKLTKYGLYHMTEYGANVSFSIGSPKYLCPEVICQGPVTLTELCPRTDEPRCVSQPPSGPKVDVWALGLILLEAHLGISLWSDLSLQQIFTNIIMLVDSKVSPVELIAAEHKMSHKLQTLAPDVLQLLKQCLVVSPARRPEPVELLDLPVFRELKNFQVPDMNGLSMFTTKLRCQHLEIPVAEDFISNEPVDHLSLRSMEEVYYLWGLAGGDLESVLRKAGLIRSSPPVTILSRYTVEEGEMFKEPRDRSTLLDDTVVTLPLDLLRQRLQHVDATAYYPLLESGPQIEVKPVNGLHPSPSSGDLIETSKQPLVIRERDVEYQFHRIILYERLLQAYPYTRPRIVKEARIDIPPLVRGQVWAALLDVHGDVMGNYDAIDKETPIPTDRQIEVDIPRCHQYNELLSSPVGHAKFKRILKAWVVTHPHYVYWQGLDSLCAPFLFLNFNDEAAAYACLKAFIPKYLHKFFLKDNSAIVQEYLAVFSHLIAFHDPELGNHLNGIGFVPELYAIPWFLTMYAHVFPLHKIFHLWDTLLLGNSSFPLYIGIAILHQLRDQLLSFGFNECILLFSDMPQIDIYKVVQESVRLFRITPRSATYRNHAPSERDATLKQVGGQHYSENGLAQLCIDNITLEELKQERCPKISAEDLIKLCELHIGGVSPARSPAKRNKSEKSPLIVIDIRQQEDYVRGTISGSINIPHNTAFTTEGVLLAADVFKAHKNQIKVVVGGPGKGAVRFAERLLQLNYSKVCVLYKGVEALKNTGFLTVPPATAF